MSVHTRSQKLAQEAFTCVEKRAKGTDFGAYETVASKFPALIHACGLAQTVAFAQSKRKKEKPTGGAECEYLADLAVVLCAGGHIEVSSADLLAKQTRNAEVGPYLRLSRDAINAATWLKRYAEALSPDGPSKTEVKP